jgi:uncharacterized membrane protein HdeD (DUF308 family)
MLHLLARYWWALALRGVFAVLFGLLTFFMPGITLVTLVLLFGAYAVLDGIFDLVSAIRSPSHHWALIIEGVVGIVAGILTFVWPAITATVLLYLIAFWAIFTGVLEIYRRCPSTPGADRRNLAHPNGSAFPAFRDVHSNLS